MPLTCLQLIRSSVTVKQLIVKIQLDGNLFLLFC